MRVCLLVNQFLHNWQIKALENLQSETDAEISLLVINEKSEESSIAESVSNKSLSMNDIYVMLDVFREQGAWSFVLAEQKLNWLLTGQKPKFWIRKHVNDVNSFQNVEAISCEPISDGNWNKIPQEIINKIDSEADIVLRFGFGLIKGDILNATDHGVISFHPADIRESRGLGPVEAFLNDDEYTYATLQILSETIDGGSIVCVEKKSIADVKTLGEVLEITGELQASMLPKGINRLQDPGFNPYKPDELGDYKPLTNKRKFSYAIRVLWKDILGRLSSNIISADE